MGGKLWRLIVYTVTLFNHKYSATMVVEGNMTSDDEKTLLMDQDRIEEASLWNDIARDH